MCIWMLEAFDLYNLTFNINGEVKTFTPLHVQYILGFNDEGDTICEDEWKDITLEDLTLNFEKLDIKTMSSIAQKLEAHDDNFKRAFVLLLMTSFLLQQRQRSQKGGGFILSRMSTSFLC